MCFFLSFFNGGGFFFVLVCDQNFNYPIEWHFFGPNMLHTLTHCGFKHFVQKFWSLETHLNTSLSNCVSIHIFSVYLYNPWFHWAVFFRGSSLLAASVTLCRPHCLIAWLWICLEIYTSSSFNFHMQNVKVFILLNFFSVCHRKVFLHSLHGSYIAFLVAFWSFCGHLHRGSTFV